MLQEQALVFHFFPRILLVYGIRVDYVYLEVLCFHIGSCFWNNQSWLLFNLLPLDRVAVGDIS